MVKAPQTRAIGLLNKRREIEQERTKMVRKAQEIRKDIYNMSKSIHEIQDDIDACIEDMGKKGGGKYKVNPISIKI